MAAGGARAVDVRDAYAMLAARGYQYGPAFQGLTAMWRRGDEIFAEVAVPGRVGRRASACIPALLDAALHAVVLGTDDDEGRWRCRSPGRRCRCTPRAPRRRGRGSLRPARSSMSIDLADGLGLPVLSVASMVARPVTAEQLAAALGGTSGGGELFEVTWTPPRADAPLPVPDGPRCRSSNLRSAATVSTSVAASYAATHARWRACRRGWPSRDRPGPPPGGRTRGAVALPGEDVTDLPAAAVWGLVRAAQTEHPGRVVLVDTDDTTLGDRPRCRGGASPWASRRS